jgi:S1-C subfamily serine protease
VNDTTIRNTITHDPASATPVYAEEQFGREYPAMNAYAPTPQASVVEADPTAPAAPTIPRAETPAAPAPEPWAAQPWMLPQMGGSGAGGTPPSDAPGGRRGRQPSALLALALLAVLAVGGVIGGLVGHATAANANTVVLGSSSAPALTVSSSTTALQTSLESVAAAVKPSVVEITSVASSGQGIGSGDILTADGYIVTNDHVVAGFSSFTVTLANGKSYTAQVVGQDAQDDLAVLKIAATGLTPVAFADSSKATVGEFAIAVGTPLGLQNTVTFGIVSALNRTASEAPSGPAGELVGLVQTTAQINPGNSGGALVNLQGQLLGIPTLEATNPETGTPASGIGYAIPASRIQYVASQLIANGKVTSTQQGFLGIQAQDVTPQVAAANGLAVQSGVLVMGFTTDAAGKSPAQSAGLKTGDVIVAVNGQAISGSDDLAGAVLNQAPGTRVTLTVQRGSSQQTLTVTLGERPASA